MPTKQIVQNPDGTLSFIITLQAPVAGTVNQAFLDTYPKNDDPTPDEEWAMKKTIDFLQEVTTAWHVRQQLQAAQAAALASAPTLGL